MKMILNVVFGVVFAVAPAVALGAVLWQFHPVLGTMAGLCLFGLSVDVLFNGRNE